MLAREQKKKDMEDDEGEDDDQKEEFIDYKDRNNGYNRKHSKQFRTIQHFWAYKWFFIILNIYIAIKPCLLLDYNFNSSINNFNPYYDIELFALICIADLGLVYTLRGPKHYSKYTYHTIELISTIIIFILSLSMNGLTAHKSAKFFERKYPLFFALYAIACLIRIYRFIELVIIP